MLTFVVVLFMLCCVFLILVVLLQAGKGGMGGILGSGGGSTIFGGRGAGTFLTKITAVCAFMFMLLSVVLAKMSTHKMPEPGSRKPQRVVAGTKRPTSQPATQPLVPQTQSLVPQTGPALSRPSTIQLTTRPSGVEKPTAPGVEKPTAPRVETPTPPKVEKRESRPASEPARVEKNERSRQPVLAPPSTRPATKPDAQP